MTTEVFYLRKMLMQRFSSDNNDTVTVLYYNAGKLEIGDTRSFTPLAAGRNFWLIKQ